VPTSRLRLSVMATHEQQHVDKLVVSLSGYWQRTFLKTYSL
jgi:7-keto-8-aminopelargonate synthetase-like enzyme